MKPTLLLSFIIMLHLHTSAGVIVRDAPRKGNIYILSIGFSSKADHPDQDKLYLKQCPVCLTDATGMPQYFRQLNASKHLADTVISYVYTSDITIDSVFNIFNRLQKTITPNDIFIFYYASIAWGIQTDETGNAEGYYAFNDNIKPGSTATHAFTLRHLKMLTDRIAAERQLIIFDTGMGNVIQPDYYRNFFNDNITEAKFSKKNRIILCPEIMSSESTDQRTNTWKGDMFKVISNMPDSFNVLHVFDTVHNRNNDSYKQFMKHWYNNQLGLMVQVSILRESDYLKILSAIKVSKESDGKRGFTLKTKPPEVDSNIVNRKKKALIIATNQYNTPSWAMLRNPVNDGQDAETVFRSLGYEVTPLYNQPREKVLDAISGLIENEVQNPYSQYIIYFAGHGYYEPRQKAGYIVCSDSKMKDGLKPTMSELSDTYIDYTVLFRNLDQLNKVILITDVCFGGTSVNSMLQTNREAASPDAEADKMKNPFKKVLASGIKEVDDFIRLHNGTVSKNSPFAAALLEALQKGNTLTFEELYAKLKSNPKLNPTPIESSFGTERVPNVFTF